MTYIGFVVLCIAGTSQADLPGTMCIRYESPPFKSLAQCETSLKRVLKSEELKAMMSLPEYDLDLVNHQCKKKDEKTK